MNLLQTKDGFSAILSDHEDNKLELPSSYSEPVYVKMQETPKNMPFLIQLYFGGLSVIGLYLFYNMIRPRK